MDFWCVFVGRTSIVSQDTSGSKEDGPDVSKDCDDMEILGEN